MTFQPILMQYLKTHEPPLSSKRYPAKRDKGTKNALSLTTKRKRAVCFTRDYARIIHQWRNLVTKGRSRLIVDCTLLNAGRTVLRQRRAIQRNVTAWHPLFTASNAAQRYCMAVPRYCIAWQSHAPRAPRSLLPRHRCGICDTGSPDR